MPVSLLDKLFTRHPNFCFGPGYIPPLESILGNYGRLGFGEAPGLEPGNGTGRHRDLARLIDFIFFWTYFRGNPGF